MFKLVRTVLSFIVVLTALTGAALGTVVATAGSSQAICAEAGNVYYSTPYAGRYVWIPTTDASDWTTGGSITRTIADGTTTTITHGSQHSIGADGKVGGKIGPIGAELTIKYNYTWSKSTATSTSVTKSWAYSFGAIAGKTYRARAYKLGRLFKYKQTRLDAYCHGIVNWYYAAVPNKSGATNWMREFYANRNQLRYDNL